MPFAYNTSIVPVLRQNLRERDFLGSHDSPIIESVVHPGALMISSSQQTCTGRRTYGGAVKICQSCRPGSQFINIRRLYMWIPCKAKIAITLVVCDDQDDIGLAFYILGGKVMQYEQ